MSIKCAGCLNSVDEKHNCFYVKLIKRQNIDKKCTDGIRAICKIELNTDTIYITLFNDDMYSIDLDKTEKSNICIVCNMKIDKHIYLTLRKVTLYCKECGIWITFTNMNDTDINLIGEYGITLISKSMK